MPARVAASLRAGVSLVFAAIPAVVIYDAFSRAIGSYRMLLADAVALSMRLLSLDAERASAAVAREAAE